VHLLWLLLKFVAHLFAQQLRQDLRERALPGEPLVTFDIDQRGDSGHHDMAPLCASSS
jgi:hypothetical protein